MDRSSAVGARESEKSPEAGQSSPPRFRLEHVGKRLEVEPSDVGLGHKATLFVDGQLRDEQQAKSQHAGLHANDFTVQVIWGDFGGVKTCVLVARDESGQALNVPFAPPPGSRAARLVQLKRELPVFYAARHLVKPVLQALVPLLGIGVLLTALLPRFDWTWLPPFIRDKLFGDGPAWLELVLSSPFFQVGKWLVPLVFALFVALDEYEKRQTHVAREEVIRGPHR